MTRISIITATYNSQEFVGDTLASLLSQDYYNREHIIVDGGSSDATLDIISKSGLSVDKLISDKDDGIYHALNKGIEVSSGDVIGFLHSDDIYANPNSLAQVASLFDNSDVGAIYGDLNYVSKDNTDNIVRRWRSGEFDRIKMAKGWMPPHPTFYMRRSLYERYGAFDLNYKISSDYDSMLRYLFKHNVRTAYLPEVLVKMRVGGESNKSVFNIMRKTNEDTRILKSHGLPVLKTLVAKNISKIHQFF